MSRKRQRSNNKMSMMYSTIFARCGSGGRPAAIVVGRISSSAAESFFSSTSSSAKVMLSSWATVQGGSTFQFRRDFSVSSKTSVAERSYKLLVLGGGTAGCAIASKFSSSLGKGHVAVVEPSEVRNNVLTRVWYFIWVVSVSVLVYT